MNLKGNANYFKDSQMFSLLTVNWTPCLLTCRVYVWDSATKILKDKLCFGVSVIFFDFYSVEIRNTNRTVLGNSNNKQENLKKVESPFKNHNILLYSAFAKHTTNNFTDISFKNSSECLLSLKFWSWMQVWTLLPLLTLFLYFNIVCFSYGIWERKQASIKTADCRWIIKSVEPLCGLSLEWWFMLKWNYCYN